MKSHHEITLEIDVRATIYKFCVARAQEVLESEDQVALAAQVYVMQKEALQTLDTGRPGDLRRDLEDEIVKTCKKYSRALVLTSEKRYLRELVTKQGMW